MGNMLVFLEQSGGKLPKSTLAAISAAHELGKVWGKSGIIGVALGAGSDTAAKICAEYGLEEVVFSTNGSFDKYLSIPYARAIKQVVDSKGIDTLVFASSSTGKDLAPRISAMMEAGQASDVIAVNGDGTLKRPMYAGNAIADVEICTPNKVVTIRPTAFQAASKGSATGTATEFTVSVDMSGAGEVISHDKPTSSRPELGDAEIVVSGGRALKSSENFMKYIGDLADAFGAAIGASRAAVDSGYAPNDWQVGQTGKVVAPSLYLAVGISGAIQHLAGMKDSKVIVAINKDPDAPIFEVADYGLVADLYEVVPALAQEVRKIKGT